ncbi:MULTISPECIES: CBS domain-containing protein [unclassified Polaribacter]|uniref:CBS domain-containing protein n=1 Tax=unclassified Polaribacter TaxID=196858 RepID=UPI0011BEE9C4|nr:MULTISPECIES: CBS domain-containing protein [unclassified Polaribacter]TXD51022.1 CBS domain-containing protein [Polaribacter sp. IC063]TXD62329.1 CBS domain-containing protein [Polaribacter sp. IC066]
MKKRIHISEIMSQNLITLNITNTIEDAKKIFEENAIRHIPIVDHKEIVGMLSYSDLLKVGYADASDDNENIDFSIYDWFTIKQVMAKNLYLVPSNSTVKEVGALLADKEFHALPVVDDGELVGIVTTTDFIRFLVDQF